MPAPPARRDGRTVHTHAHAHDVHAAHTLDVHAHDVHAHPPLARGSGHAAHAPVLAPLPPQPCACFARCLARQAALHYRQRAVLSASLLLAGLWCSAAISPWISYVDNLAVVGRSSGEPYGQTVSASVQLGLVYSSGSFGDGVTGTGSETVRSALPSAAPARVAQPIIAIILLLVAAITSLASAALSYGGSLEHRVLILWLSLLAVAVGAAGTGLADTFFRPTFDSLVVFVSELNGGSVPYGAVSMPALVLAAIALAFGAVVLLVLRRWQALDSAADYGGLDLDTLLRCCPGSGRRGSGSAFDGALDPVVNVLAPAQIGAAWGRKA